MTGLVLVTLITDFAEFWLLHSIYIIYTHVHIYIYIYIFEGGYTEVCVWEVCVYMSVFVCVCVCLYTTLICPKQEPFLKKPDLLKRTQLVAVIKLLFYLC